MTRERIPRRRPASGKKEYSQESTVKSGSKTRDKYNRAPDSQTHSGTKDKDRPASGRNRDRPRSGKSRVTIKDVLAEQGSPTAKKMYIVQIPRKAITPERIKDAIRAHELSRSMTALSVSSAGDKERTHFPAFPDQNNRRRFRKWRPKSASVIKETDKVEENRVVNGTDSRKWRATRYSRFKYPQHLHYREIPNQSSLESRIPYCMRQFPKYTQLPLKQDCVYTPWGSVSYSCGHTVASAHLPHPRRGESVKIERPMSAPPSIQCTARGEATVSFDNMRDNSIIGLGDEDDGNTAYLTAYEELTPTVIVEEDDDKNGNISTLQLVNEHEDENYSDDNFDTGRESEEQARADSGSRRSSITSPQMPSSRPQSGYGESVHSSRPGSGQRSSGSGQSSRPQSGRRSNGSSGRPHSARRFSGGSAQSSRTDSARSDHSNQQIGDRRDSQSSNSHFSPRPFSDNDDIPEENENGDSSSKTKPQPDHYDPDEEASEVEDEA